MTDPVAARHYPCTFEMTVYLVKGDMIAKAKFTLPAGTHPTEAEIRDGIVKCLEAAKEASPGDWRACDRREFIGEIFAEKTGQRDFAVPGPAAFARVLSREKLA